MADERRTPTPTLAAAMRVLAAEVESPDGVANVAIAEAAQRLDELHAAGSLALRTLAALWRGEDVGVGAAMSALERAGCGVMPAEDGRA